jgi:hypothetical protein
MSVLDNIKTINFVIECNKNKMEPCIDHSTNKLYVMCPKIPPKEVQDKLSSIAPTDYELAFKEGVKPTTWRLIEQILRANLAHMAGYRGQLEKKRLIVHIDTERIIDTDPMMHDLIVAINLDGYPTSIELIINKESQGVCCPAIANEVQNNRACGETITENKVTDVKISLGLYKSVDEFLKHI